MELVDDDWKTSSNGNQMVSLYMGSWAPKKLEIYRVEIQNSLRSFWLWMLLVLTSKMLLMMNIVTRMW